MGIGLCIRDEDESYVLAKTVWFSPLCSLEVGETLGLYHALIWTVDIRLDNMDFMLDSNLVVEAFNGDNNYRTEVDSII